MSQLNNKKSKNSLLQVEKWFLFKNFSKSVKGKAKKYSSSLNSLTCFNLSKSSSKSAITNMKELMAKLKPNKDRLPSTDTTTHTKKETYSYFRLKLVVLVSTLRALILSSFTTQIGTLRTTSKQQPELTESVKRVKSWSTVWSLAILMRQKCLKEQHKNLVSIRLFL